MTTPHQAPSPQPSPAAQPAQQPWQQGGFVSPLPVQRTHLGHALLSEWTKIRTVRSTLWTLGIMLLLVVGIGLLVNGLMSSTGDLGGAPALAGGFFGVLLGSICVITLGVLVITSEYGTGMIRTTLTACPSRPRVLAAKAIVFFLVALVLTTLATTIVALADNAALGSGHGATPAGGDAWFRATLGSGLYVALLGLLALAVGALLRHSAGAITTMLGVVLLPLLLALFMQVQSLEKVRTALVEYSVPNALAAVYGIPMLDNGPKGWTPVWILAAVTAVALGGAFAAVGRRDV